MFSSSQKDSDTSSEERNPSTTSPSSRDKGLEREEPEDDLLQVPNDNKPPIQSVVGPNGLRKVIMLAIWTINDFISTTKENHFKTLRGKYQIPDHIPFRLPYKSEKCYYDGVDGVGVYE